MDDITTLCKNRGFIFQGSDIYGGLSNTWDYGPLGVELKNNIKKVWIKKFVQESSHNVLLDSAILMNPKVWEASGHISGFSDPLVDCRSCKMRFRADKLIEDSGKTANGLSFEQMEKFIDENNVVCPNCGNKEFTKIRKFNLMFKTFQGVTEESKNEIFLRPETAQGIFVNFVNVQRSMRKKLPFGIAQVGKSFRNEITPGNFIFRTREFEQIELEFFCKPGTDIKWFNFWKDFSKKWLQDLGIEDKNIRIRDHSREELCHYSSATSDIEYKFPFGWGELWGIADRTDFDLKQHQNYSNKTLEYFDSENEERYIPYVIEPSVGVDRLVLAFLCNSYKEEQVGEKDKRVVMKIHPALAPYKACVLPLSKKLEGEAEKIKMNLSKHFMVDFDCSGSIGRRYRRQDEIGTPFCITYDFDSLNDNCVTVRNRDSMIQERVKIDCLKEYICSKIDF